MEVRPGYKQTEVGVIPEEWDATPLKGKIGIAHGFAFASMHFASHGPYRLTTPGHFYETGGFRDIGEKQKYYVGPVPNDYVLQPGDVIVAMTEQADGLLGSAAVIPKEHGYLHNQRLGRVKTLSSEIELAYLVYVFNSPSYRAKVRETAAGTKVKHTSPGKLLEISIRLPRPPEQRAIAEALSDVDGLLGALDRLIAKKRDLKQAAMQQLLTGQTRLPGFHGQWETKRLGNLCTMKSGEGITAKNIDIVSLFPCYGGNGLRGFTTRFTHDGNYCLIGRVGALCGNLFEVTGRFFASEHAIVVTPFEGVDISWLTLALGTLRLNGRAESSAQPVLTVSKLLPLEVVVPATKAEQSGIAEVLSDMDAELTALEQRQEKNRALKQGMMQELLTGKTRLISPELSHA
ncbi:MAG: restriction endonuclease subunit S [Planctomycetia bacterium]|nr:restriction endonuclease subunit S [Planctomycetia bacterium]